MPTPKSGYYAADGKRVPGVTTIIGRFKQSDALMYWAWNEGREGRDFRDTSGRAADIGTLAHAFVEAKLKGKPEPDLSKNTEEERAKVMSAYGAYETWQEQSKIEVVEVEIQMVSEKYRFGGTPDAIMEHGGKLALGDWKSSNGVYADHLIQMAAYKELWEENHPGEHIDGGFHLCRFSKEHGDFAHHYFPDLSEAWEQFLLFRRAYEIDKGLKKRAA